MTFQDRAGQLLRAGIRAGMFPGAVAARAAMGEGLDLPLPVAAGKTGVRPPTDAVDGETVYDLASLTKPLATTVLVLIARREGRLALDAPVGRFLPETAGTWIAGVPLVRLLTHTSGLPAWVPLYGVATDREGWIRPLAGEAPASSPGTAVTYSCPGFLLLGAIVERVFGQRLAGLFRERVAEPLGLRDRIGYGPPAGVRLAAPSLHSVAELDALAAGGYDGVKPPPGNRPDDGNARFLGGAAGNAGLFGTVDAVLRLAVEFLPGTPETVLTDEERRLAISNHTPGLEQARGLGWQLAATPGCSAGPALSPTAYGHTGFTGTSVWVDPQRRIAMALLSNRNHPVFRGVDLHPLRRRFHALCTA